MAKCNQLTFLPFKGLNQRIQENEKLFGSQLNCLSAAHVGQRSSQRQNIIVNNQVEQGQ